MSLREFLAIQRTDVKQETAEKLYSKYQKDHEERQVRLFFKEHKVRLLWLRYEMVWLQRDEWFLEKYDPIVCEQIKEEKLKETQNTAMSFFERLSKGEFASLKLEIGTDQLSNLLELEANQFLQLSTLNPGEFDHKLYTSDLIIPGSFQVLSSPYFGFDPDCQTLFIKSVPRDCPREDLLDEFIKLEGKSYITRLHDIVFVWTVEVSKLHQIRMGSVRIWGCLWQGTRGGKQRSK